jgi:hypothetical protein
MVVGLRFCQSCLTFAGSVFMETANESLVECAPINQLNLCSEVLSQCNRTGLVSTVLYGIGSS